MAAQFPRLLGGKLAHGHDLLHAEEAGALHVQIGQLLVLPLALGFVDQKLQGI